MKARIGALLLLTFGSAFAQSAFLRDLAQLTAQRDQALAVAAVPINRRYKEGLDALLRRAMQANDLDAAIEIREALGKIPAGPSAIAPIVERTTEVLPNRVGTLTGLKILSAKYGTEDLKRVVDVTQRIRGACEAGQESMQLDAVEGPTGKDPAPLTKKFTTIVYSIYGKQRTKAFGEGHELNFRRDLP